MIDWEDLRIGCNRIKGTDYRSIKDMLEGLYEKHRSTWRVGDYLGICHRSVSNKMKSYGLPLKYTKRERRVEPKILEMGRFRIKGMTLKQISKKVGCHPNYAGVVCRKAGWEYKTDKPVPLYKITYEKLKKYDPEEIKRLTVKQIAELINYDATTKFKYNYLYDILKKYNIKYRPSPMRYYFYLRKIGKVA